MGCELETASVLSLFIVGVRWLSLHNHEEELGLLQSVRYVYIKHLGLTDRLPVQRDKILIQMAHTFISLSFGCP
jgi:hypothetical protein